MQAAWFAAAAVWFPLTAVRRGQEPRPVATAPRLPHAAAMAAMAWMTHSMAGCVARSPVPRRPRGTPGRASRVPRRGVNGRRSGHRSAGAVPDHVCSPVADPRHHS
ncbi:DUF5134 domain-containing protein [Streptomyces sp. NPDC004546]|uniref:DUF5134 domain-containing protein n=1 Tax=Streptomyces sp. NPDC004546 TaxID=3154282 RepID=UPI0033B79263